ncbi:hypothetical protein ACFL3G_09685 [Planctomycetota bacterium]
MLSEIQIKSAGSLKNIIFAAFVVVGAFILYDRIVLSHVNYSRVVQENVLIMDDIARKENLIQTCVGIKKKELEELQDKFKHIHTKLFNTVEADEFFSDIQAIAELANCTVYSLNFSATNTTAEGAGQSKVTNNISTNSATLTVAGDYTEIVNMINNLQNRSERVWTDSISIESIEDSEVLKCELTIRIYVIDDKRKHRHG